MDYARFHAALRAAIFFQRTCRLRRLLIAHGVDAFAGSLGECPPQLIAETLARLPVGSSHQVNLALPLAARRRLRRRPASPSRSNPASTAQDGTTVLGTGEAT